MAPTPIPMLPPLPMPRYMRPGGYSATSAAQNPYAPKAGPLGQLFGWGDNPLYQSLKPLLSDVGYGLATGANLSEGLGNALEHRAQMEPHRQQQALLAYQFDSDSRSKDATARAISNMGPEFKDVADAVANGSLDPREGWNTAFKRQTDAATQAQVDARNRGNAQYLKDPALKAMVESGAMEFADAYKLERGETDPGELGQTVYLGRDQQGNPVPMQVGQQGFVQSQLPDGITFDPGGMAGARTTATVDAKTAGAARAALPAAQQGRAITDRAITEIRNNAAGMQQWFGQIGPRGMYVDPGSPMGKFVTATKNANAQAFMQARTALKGGGQITDYEGRRAEDAYSRMQAALETGDLDSYLRAIADFEAAVADGYNKLLEVAQGGYAAGGDALTSGYSGTDYKSRYGLE